MDHDYRLPDKAQELVTDAICRPDFTSSHHPVGSSGIHRRAPPPSDARTVEHATNRQHSASKTWAGSWCESTPTTTLRNSPTTARYLVRDGEKKRNDSNR